MTETEQAVDTRELARRSFRAIEHPGSEDLGGLVHPEFRNWEAVGPAADLRGPQALSAPVEMLNRTFSELRYDAVELIAERDLVAARTVMHGVHTGPMRGLAPTGKRLAQGQSPGTASLTDVLWSIGLHGTTSASYTRSASPRPCA